MKQETGSNTISSDRAYEQKVLSILLVRDGLYFSVLSEKNTIISSGRLCYELPEAKQTGNQALELLTIIYGDNKFLSDNYKKVNLIIDTARTTPVPHDWIDTDNYADWLTYAGFLPLPHECVVIGKASEEMAMVMPIDKSCHDFILEQYECDLNYVHPLQILGSVAQHKTFIAVSIDQSEAYVAAVEDGKTKCLMPLVFKGEAEAIFCLRKLATEFKTQPQLLFATADKSMAQLLASQFKGAINLNSQLEELALFNVKNCLL